MFELVVVFIANFWIEFIADEKNGFSLLIRPFLFYVKILHFPNVIFEVKINLFLLILFNFLSRAVDPPLLLP